MASDVAISAAEKIYRRHLTWRMTNLDGTICETEADFKPRWVKNAARIIEKEISQYIIEQTGQVSIEETREEGYGEGYEDGYNEGYRHGSEGSYTEHGQ